MTASQNHIAQGLRELYKFDLDPRVSLAYRPFSNDKTVIRADFGIFAVTTLGPMSFNNAGNPTSNLLTNVNSPSGANGGMEVRSGGGAILRPDCGAGNPHQRSPGFFFNINAFSETPAGAGRFGNCGVGILEGPNLINVNSGVAKTLSVRERYKLRSEATYTNVFNHANFAPPQMNISNSGTSGALNAVLPQGSGGNRTGQAALRLDF